MAIYQHIIAEAFMSEKLIRRNNIIIVYVVRSTRVKVAWCETLLGIH